MSAAGPITTASAIGSVLLCAALSLGYVWSRSELALAQAADSLVDVASAVVLALAVRVSRRPGDEGHPFGHRSAEPLAALGVAMLAGILAYQVARDAVATLQAGQHDQVPQWLSLLFLLKAAFRGGIMLAIRRAPGASPALAALWVDARNDVLLAGVSVFGVIAGKLGYPRADPLLALPMALWIGWSGIELGRGSIGLLMGEAPAPARVEGLRRLAAVQPGIRGVHDLRVRHVGQFLEVHVHVVVDARLTIGEAHDLGESVRMALEREADVERCHVHLDVADDAG